MPPKARGSGVEHPPNCPDIVAGLTNHELIRRLQLLVKAVRDLDQDDNLARRYTPLCLSLCDQMQSKNPHVNVLMACALADLLRVSVNANPFEEYPDRLKDVLVFIVRQLRGLDNANDSMFTYYYHLLETVAAVSVLNSIVDTEHADHVLCHLIKHTFALLCSQKADIQQRTASLIVDTIVCLVKDMHGVSNQALDLLCENILEPRKTQSPPACEAATEVLRRSESVIESYLISFVSQAMSVSGSADSSVCGESSIVQSGRTYQLVARLYEILPDVMHNILPQLEYKLQVDNDKERLSVTKQLGRMIMQPENQMLEHFKQLVTAYFARAVDKNTDVRAMVVLQCITLFKQKDMQSMVQAVLKDRLHDPDESVRLQCVKTLGAASQSNVLCVDTELITLIAERVRDKKEDVRKEALLCLGKLYKRTTKASDVVVPPELLSAMCAVADTLLHTYYSTFVSDRVLVEKLVHTCLAPLDLAAQPRIDALVRLYCSIDESSVRAFGLISNQQHTLRAHLRQVLALYEQTDPCEADMQTAVTNISKQLHTHTEQEVASMLEQLCADKQALSLFHYILGTQYDTSTLRQRMKELLQRVTQFMPESLMAVLKLVLERCGQFLCDQQAADYLLTKMEDAINGDLTVGTCSSEHTMQRIMHLIKLLSKTYGHCFANVVTMNELLHVVEGVEGNTDCCSDVTKQYAIQALYNTLDYCKHNHLHTDTTGVYAKLAHISEENGTEPKLVKWAVYCLVKAAQSPEHDNRLEQLLKKRSSELDMSVVGAERVVCALAALSALIEHYALKWQTQFDSLMPVIVEVIILHKQEFEYPDDTTGTDGQTMVDWEDLSPQAQVICWGVQLLTDYVCALNTDHMNYASSSLRMFCSFLETHADIHNSGNIRVGERNRMKLTVAVCMLQMCEHNALNALLPPDMFRLVAALILDDSVAVRTQFLNVLAEKLKLMRLPIQFMVILPLTVLRRPVDSGDNKLLVENARLLLTVQVARWRALIKHNASNVAGTILSRPAESTVAYLLHILAHSDRMLSLDILNVTQPTELNLDVLYEMKACIAMLLQCLIADATPAQRNAALNYVVSLIKELRRRTDAQGHDVIEDNMRLWSLCALTECLVLYRMPQFEITCTPVASGLSNRWFKASKKAKEFENQALLPAELVNEEKANVAHTKRGRAKPVPVVVEKKAGAASALSVGGTKARPNTTSTAAGRAKARATVAPRKRPVLTTPASPDPVASTGTPAPKRHTRRTAHLHTETETDTSDHATNDTPHKTLDTITLSPPLAASTALRGVGGGVGTRSSKKQSLMSMYVKAPEAVRLSPLLAPRPRRSPRSPMAQMNAKVRKGDERSDRSLSHISSSIPDDASSA